MREQDLYGMGQGLAQVISMDRSLQTYLTLQQKKAAFEQKEAQVAQELINSYDPSKQKGIRAVDIPEYTALYNEWKNLHLQNKDLLRNPAKYPDQIRKADELKQKMLWYQKESPRQYELEGQIASAYLKDKNNLSTGAVTLAKELPNVSLGTMKQKLGRTYNFADFEFKAPEIKDDFIIGEIQQTAYQNGLYETGIKEEGEVPNTFTKIVRRYEKYKPEAVTLAYGHATVNDPDISKFYNQSFAAMTPQQIAQMQNDVKAITGKYFQIKTGDDLGVASWILKGSYNYGKQETVVDQVKKDAADMNMFKQQLKARESSQIKVANIKHNLAVQRKQMPSGDNMFIRDWANNFVQAQQSGNHQAVRQYINETISKSGKSSGRAEIVGYNMNGGNKETPKSYESRYKYFMDRVYPGYEEADINGAPVKRDGNYIKQSYQRGDMVVFFPVPYDEPQKDKDGKPLMNNGQPVTKKTTRYIPIDPRESVSDKVLTFLLERGYKFKTKDNPTDYGLSGDDEE